MRGLFCRKAVQSRSLILGFSFLVLVQLTTLGEHLSNSIHGGNNYFSSINHIHHHHLSLLTLCSRRVKQSQTVRSRRFESNLLTWPGRPNTHTFGTPSGRSQTTVCLSFQSVDQGHPPQLQSLTTLHPHVALILDQVQKRVQGHSTCRSNQVRT